MRNYTENLMQKGEERKRLTSQLQTTLDQVGAQIAESVPTGTIASVGGWNYKAMCYRSNVGTMYALAVESDGDNWEWNALVSDAPPGGSFWLHGDFGTSIPVATRDEFLHFATALPEVVKAFEAEEQGIIDSLRAAFENLRKVAGE